jgi:hypothetical protein
MSENSRLLSLNHDLGDDADETGSNVLLWIEQKVATINLNYQESQSIQQTCQRVPKWRPLSSEF